MFYLKYSFIFIMALLTVLNCNTVASENRKQDAKCLLPMEPGPCRMSLTRFYYNAKTNNCEEFKFGGCMGNDNKFGFKQTCEAACKKSDASTTTRAGSISSTTEKITLVNKQLKSDTLKSLATTGDVTPTTTTTTPQPRLSRTTVKSKSSPTATARSIIIPIQKSNKF